MYYLFVFKIICLSISNAEIKTVTWFTEVFSLTVESGDRCGSSSNGTITLETRFPSNPPADKTKVHICDVAIKSPDSSYVLPKMFQ